MGTIPRAFSEDQIYHVFSRGVHKDVIYKDNSDRVYFLSKLDEYCERDNITVLAYCLMDNHFHLALRQDGRLPLSKSLRSLLIGYARRYNAKYGTSGALFQGRFRAKLVHDEQYLIRLSAYIHLNPAPFADYRRYRWSSYRQYVSPKSGFCDPGPVLDLLGGSTTSYAIYVEKAVSYEEPSFSSYRSKS